MHSSILCVLYGSVSSLSNIANKSLYSAFPFPFTFSVLFTQFLFLQALLLLLVVRLLAPKFIWKEFKQSGIFSFCFISSLLFGLFGIGQVNLAMYVALRKLVTLFLYLWNFDRKHFEPRIALAVLGITVGALIAGSQDLTANFQGYSCVLVANMLTAATFQQSHKLSSTHKIPALSQSYYLSIVSLPVLALCAWAYDHSDQLIDLSFTGPLMICSLAGCVNNLLMLKCCSEVSPLATSVTGQVKDFFTLLVGLFLFTEAKSSWEFIMGLGVSMGSAIGYAVIKLRS